MTETSWWRKWVFYRKECVKTTWTFRLALAGSFIFLVSMTRGFWVPGIGHGLVCKEEVGRTDALLVENFDSDYLLFERAEALYSAGLAPRVVVPIIGSAAGRESRIENAFTDLMIRVAQLEKAETIPVSEMEPISLNQAIQVRDFLVKQNIRSVAVVTAGFRSTRSSLVYRAVLGRAGIAASCVPVFGKTTPESWTSSWHGIQDIAEQFLKLQYYRFYVLPAYAWRGWRA